jgi:acyl carrier protein
MVVTGRPEFQHKAVELSLRILLGDHVVEDLGPQFVQSFAEKRGHWSDAIRSLWQIGQREMDSVAQRRRLTESTTGLPTGSFASSSAVHETIGSFDGPPVAQAGDRPVDMLTPTGPTIESPASTVKVTVFDPATDGSGDMPEQRTNPWTYEEIRDRLVALIEEITGYPPEVLDDDLDLEADLAIDSVKQVEALSSLREHYLLGLEESFRMRDFRTIRSIATYLQNRLNTERLVSVPW